MQGFLISLLANGFFDKFFVRSNNLKLEKKNGILKFHTDQTLISLPVDSRVAMPRRRKKNNLNIIFEKKQTCRSTSFDHDAKSVSNHI
jgi:hypothetical protein